MRPYHPRLASKINAPVATIILAYVFLDEAVSLLRVAGSLLVLAGGICLLPET